MGQSTAIEWTDATWNPVRGCSRVSEGCRNCYAERTAARFAKPGIGIIGEPSPIPSDRPAAYPAGPFFGFVTKVNGHPAWTGKVELVEKHLADPLMWRAPRKIFVNSMSDLFHEALSFDDVLSVFQIMAKCPAHTFQILTKRPGRMLEFLRHRRWRNLGYSHAMNGDHYVALIQDKEYPQDAPFLPNVWLGVSVEDQKTADERIPLLLQTPAAVRFVSYEPALGPVDFTGLNGKVGGTQFDALVGRWDQDDLCGPSLDWIIVGGESGPAARPFDVAWAKNTAAQCKAAGVACFIKQLGAKVLSDNSSYGIGYWTEDGDVMGPIFADRKGGNWDEWPTDLRIREFPGGVRV